MAGRFVDDVPQSYYFSLGAQNRTPMSVITAGKFHTGEAKRITGPVSSYFRAKPCVRYFLDTLVCNCSAGKPSVFSCSKPPML